MYDPALPSIEGKRPKHSSRLRNDFKNYCKICFQEKGYRVKNWIILNEPWTISSFGYSLGKHTPGCGPHECFSGSPHIEPYIVGHNLILAHGEAVNLYKNHFQSGRPNPKSKCKLIEVGGTGAMVTEGVVASTDPNELVNFVQLGRDAIKVWVVNATVPDVVLWRPTSDLVCIEDVVGSTVAWPAAEVVTESSSSNHC